MEIANAVKILTDLANGADPATGALLPVDCPCQQPESVRALFTVLQLVAPSAEPLSESKAERSTADCVGDVLFGMIADLFSLRCKLAELTEQVELRAHLDRENILERESPWSDRAFCHPAIEEHLAIATYRDLTPVRADFLFRAYVLARSVAAEEGSREAMRYDQEPDVYDCQNHDDINCGYLSLDAVHNFAIACDSAMNSLVESLNSSLAKSKAEAAS